MFKLPAGRMNLSSYLGGSLLMSVLGLGWGLGLMGLTPLSALLVATGSWLLLLALAHL